MRNPFLYHDSRPHAGQRVPHHATPRPRLWWGVCLVAALLMGAAANEARAAVGAPDYAATRTAAVFAYRWMHGRLQPYKAFNAVVLNSRYLLTASDALKGAGLGMVKRGGEGEGRVSPVRMYAVVRGKQGQVVVRCRPSSVTVGPLTALEVNAWDRGRLEQVLGDSPRIGSLLVGATAQAVGTLIPFGLSPGELGKADLPIQIGLGVEITSVRRSIDGQAVALLEPALPEDLIGSGLWNRRGELIGILIRKQGKWRAASVEPIIRALTAGGLQPMREARPIQDPSRGILEGFPFLQWLGENLPLVPGKQAPRQPRNRPSYNDMSSDVPGDAADRRDGRAMDAFHREPNRRQADEKSVRDDRSVEARAFRYVR